VDGAATQNLAYRDGFVFIPIYFMKVYAGGLPNGIVPPLGGSSFVGCIQDVTINSVSYTLATSTEKYAVISGCPSAATTTTTG
jgi:hypothetical protein